MRLLYLFLCVFCFACSPQDQEEAFLAFSRQFQKEKWKQYPLWAALDGQLPFDTLLPIASPERCQADLAFTQKQLKNLARFDAERLTAPMRFEHQKIKTYLDVSLKNLQEPPLHQSDPSFYNLNEAFRSLWYKSNLSEERKYQIAHYWLQQLPDYYAAAKANLQQISDPKKIHLAITQQKQLFRFLNQKITPNLPPKEQPFFRNAQLAQKDYIAWLSSQKFEFLASTPPLISDN